MIAGVQFGVIQGDIQCGKQSQWGKTVETTCRRAVYHLNKAEDFHRDASVLVTLRETNDTRINNHPTYNLTIAVGPLQTPRTKLKLVIERRMLAVDDLLDSGTGIAYLIGSKAKTYLRDLIASALQEYRGSKTVGQPDTSPSSPNA